MFIKANLMSTFHVTIQLKGNPARELLPMYKEMQSHPLLKIPQGCEKMKEMRICYWKHALASPQLPRPGVFSQKNLLKAKDTEDRVYCRVKRSSFKQ